VTERLAKRIAFFPLLVAAMPPRARFLSERLTAVGYSAFAATAIGFVIFRVSGCFSDTGSQESL
jgi:hypothetical protein